MIKKILFTFFVFIGIGAALYGTWYYMDMQVKAAQDETIAVNGQLTTTKAELIAAQNELKVKVDAEAVLATHLTSFDELMALGSQIATGQSTATGQLIGTGSQNKLSQLGATLNNLYDSGLKIEGKISAENLRKYSFEFQQDTSNVNIIAQPIKLAQGEWTAVVQVLETPLVQQATVKTVSTSTGSLLKEKLTPLLPQRELVVVLAKWANGKITEQYEFPYAGEANESKILEYLKK